MTFKVQLTKQAQADLQEIYDYIAYALLSPETADSMIARIRKAVAELSEMPERFRRYEESPFYEQNLRMMPVGNYIVFYIPQEKVQTVTIIRIVYGGRDIGKLLHIPNETTLAAMRDADNGRNLLSPYHDMETLIKDLTSDDE